MNRLQVAQRANVPPFHVMELLAAATRRATTHGDAIMLCVGQPSTPAPEPVRRRVAEAVQTQTLGYSEAKGILEAWEAGAGKGVVTYNGKMIENLHVDIARRVLDTHKAIVARS